MSPELRPQVEYEGTKKGEEGHCTDLGDAASRLGGC